MCVGGSVGDIHVDVLYVCGLCVGVYCEVHKTVCTVHCRIDLVESKTECTS